MRSKITLKTIVLALAVTLLNVSGYAMDKEGLNIVETLKRPDAADGNRFSRLYDLLQVTGLDKVLMQGGPYTIFAPTDSAFEAYGIEHGVVLDDLIRNPKGIEDVKKILLNHVVSGNITEDQIEKMPATANMDGQTVTFGSNDDYYTVNGANIIDSNIDANNGTIHAVDKVLIPAAS